MCQEGVDGGGGGGGGGRGGGGGGGDQRQELKYRSEEAFKLNFCYRDTL